jgi:sulfur-carrier protein
MPHIFFAASIQRHVPMPEREIDALTVREALDAIFLEQPKLRGYILDDQSALRKHLAVFIDGQPVRDRQYLTDALASSSQVHVIQALSGG